MVIVRTSPHVKISPDKNSTQWPPKSPFQALLSSPSGRKKWQERGCSGRGEGGSGSRSREREGSTSPSPMKNTQRSSRALQAIASPSPSLSPGALDDEHLDEEERQAQLELAAIEAKLKLERIRARKKVAAIAAAGAGNGPGVEKRDPTTTTTFPRKSLGPSVSHPELRTSYVEVPLSPIRAHVDSAEQMSPARRRLGINAPALAQDVSLKRARDGAQLPRSASERSAVGDDKLRSSFNDRLRATQKHADDREAKLDRVERVRSKGFGGVAQKMGRPGESEEGAPGATFAKPGSSVKRKAVEPSKAQRHSSQSAQVTSQAQPKGSGLFKDIAQSTGETSGNRPTSRSRANPEPGNNVSDTSTSTSFDSYSELHLTKRHIPHPAITRALENKEIYTLPRLLKKVTAPNYDPPDCESDWVLFAILASKSSPYDQKQHHRTNDEGKPQDDAEAPRNKFMVLKLCDLKWEIDCFLFGTAFDQFWKLTPGTLLAILNPDILPPKTNQHSGRFSLKLGSSEDCVMEIGVVRDLDYCNSVKKDGQLCGDWVDKRSTEICEFHLNLFIEKQRKGRMEVNGMFRSHGEGGQTGHGIKTRGREAGGFDKQMREQQLGRKTGAGNIKQSREFGTLYSVGASTADLLDAEDRNQLSSWTEGEASRRRLAAKEEERKLQRTLQKLGGGGDSVGAAYMREKSGFTSASDSRSLEARKMFEKPKAADLGLLNNRATTAHLSPAKERKKHFGLGAMSTAGRDAIGWGGARRVEASLLKSTAFAPSSSSAAAKRLASPERGQTRLDITGDGMRPSAIRAQSRDGSQASGSLSPRKKKARFLLAEKGLRTPGRESGGVELGIDAEDEDDLVIV
ncbi:hypothetical protein LTR62_007674 [Meristemomyces frigidus]|uniref:Zinc finger Mcm10/DnaG-type domain-containing protein n=1 Tax=Meristemomyces frigidus TaxID=1508187 RepID=A0AAN7TAW0_9PEZI|nr:hypothetical protein LTR62_007674 [Meristemomyces frigidus]